MPKPSFLDPGRMRQGRCDSLAQFFSSRRGHPILPTGTHAAFEAGSGLL